MAWKKSQPSEKNKGANGEGVGGKTSRREESKFLRESKGGEKSLERRKVRTS